METGNCLPNNCESKIHLKNGPSGADIKDFKITNIRKNDEVPKHIKNEDPIEELASQLKDVSTAIDGGDKKVVGKSANGYWTGTNYCENGIDKDKFKSSNSSDNENRLAAAAVQVVSESQTTHESIRDLSQDEDETSSTSTSTTTISTASPESKSDFESESCASDQPVGDNVLNKLTKSSEKGEKQLVNSSGPFECTYVTCGNNSRSLPLTVHNLNQLPTTNALKLESCASAMPSVTNASSMHLVSGPMSHQTCSYERKFSTSVDENSDLLQMKLSSELFSKDADGEIRYEVYTSELQMGVIMKLIQKDLSEPYSIYTYRYFIHNWPKLCFLAMIGSECVGAIVCKLDLHKKVIRRGYIAMLAVDEKFRKRKIGSNLVLQAIQAMISDDADEVVLETEISNKPALRLYENLGFVRDKRLFRYYLNGVDALRLKLWLH